MNEADDVLAIPLECLSNPAGAAHYWGLGQRLAKEVQRLRAENESLRTCLACLAYKTWTETQS